MGVNLVWGDGRGGWDFEWDRGADLSMGWGIFWCGVCAGCVF